MLTSKQRAALRGAANNMETIFQVGKGGVGQELAHQVKNALDARELIKLRVLDASGITAREAAEELAAATGAQVVQVIGSRFILFLQKPKESRYADLL